MSSACEAIGNEVEEVSQAVSRSRSDDKDAYEEEELDYEEEMEYQAKSNNTVKNEEEGELSDDTNDNQAQVNRVSKDKDEGELDDEDDLEEGEVKEDNEEDEGALPEEEEEEESPKVELDDPKRNRNSDSQSELRNSSRHELQRPNKSYYNNSNNNSYFYQNYNNSRPYTSSRTNDRYTSSSRTREYNQYPLTPVVNQSESAWERGLKQARELLSKASKRKEEEVDFENKRFNMTTSVENTQLAEANTQFNLRVRSSREKSPLLKRRRHSQHSSSEDEVERRHRLAYDAAPWNNPSSSNYQSGNYRSNKPANYSSNRSAETYRDPWRRSKSPKLSSSLMNRNKKPELDTRYGEMPRSRNVPANSDVRGDHRYGSNNNNGGGVPKRSDSMSSLSSIDSHTSNLSSKSPRRKLPYSRPGLETGNRYDRDLDLPGRNDTFPKSRMDKIPKKSNASAHQQTSDRVSEAKSFDSWSESLSDSESSSFYSDSSDESDVEKDSTRDHKASKKLATDKRSQGKLAKSEGVTTGSRGPKDTISREAYLKNKALDAAKKRQEKEAKKPPIKMTFMKTQTSLKKDRLIDEQLNGEELKSPPETMVEDMETNHSVSSSKFSSKSINNSKSHSEDEDVMKPNMSFLPQQVREGNVDLSSSSSSSSNSNNHGSNKMHRREELLMKLKAVEEAIERKLLNSKKE